MKIVYLIALVICSFISSNSLAAGNPGTLPLQELFICEGTFFNYDKNPESEPDAKIVPLSVKLSFSRAFGTDVIKLASVYGNFDIGLKWPAYIVVKDGNIAELNAETILGNVPVQITSNLNNEGAITVKTRVFEKGAPVEMTCPKDLLKQFLSSHVSPW